MQPQYRQGDLLLCAVEAFPSGLTPVAPSGDRLVLAEGEVTGHAHAVGAKRASLFHMMPRNRSFLMVKAAGARLSHEEHREIRLPRGFYEVVRQREYAPERVRLVAD